MADRTELDCLDIGQIVDVNAELREMTRATNPVGEMTAAIREAQAAYQPLPIPDVAKSLRDDSVAARIPESVASLAATIPASVRAAMNPGGALQGALRDIERINRHVPRRNW